MRTPQHISQEEIVLSETMSTFDAAIELTVALLQQEVVGPEIFCPEGAKALSVFVGKLCEGLEPIREKYESVGEG